MSSQFIMTFLCCVALFISLDHIILVNAAPVLPDCGRVKTDYNATGGNPLYSHSELFGAAATPTDVEAFKYYCINDLIATIIPEDVVRKCVC